MNLLLVEMELNRWTWWNGAESMDLLLVELELNRWT